MEQISSLANEMTRLFIYGHDAVQTPEFEAVRKAYLRAEAERVWRGVGLVPKPDAVLG